MPLSPHAPGSTRKHKKKTPTAGLGTCWSACWPTAQPQRLTGSASVQATSHANMFTPSATAWQCVFHDTSGSMRTWLGHAGFIDATATARTTQGGRLRLTATGWMTRLCRRPREGHIAVLAKGASERTGNSIRMGRNRAWAQPTTAIRPEDTQSSWTMAKPKATLLAHADARQLAPDLLANAATKGLTSDFGFARRGLSYLRRVCHIRLGLGCRGVAMVGTYSSPIDK